MPASGFEEKKLLEVCQIVSFCKKYLLQDNDRKKHDSEIESRIKENPFNLRNLFRIEQYKQDQAWQKVQP